MSTTIKRVALVAVAALGLGVVSVAPSQAFTQADTLVLSSATASQLTGETLTAGSASTTLSFLAGAAADTMTVAAYLISAPAGNTALPTLALVETANAVVANTATGAYSAYGTVLGQTAYVASTGATKAVSAKFNVYMDAPAKAGTYVVKVTPSVTVTGNGSLASSAQTLTITVAANPATDTVAASATSYITAGETYTAAYVAADQVVTSTKTPNAAGNADAAAVIRVSLLNAAGKDVTAESYTATIAGPGVLGAGTIDSNGLASGVIAQGRSLLVQYNNVVAVFPDGTSGVSTITISSAAGVVLATKKVTFFGAPATVTSTVAKAAIGAVATAATLKVSVLDAAGVSVSNLAGKLGVVSSDTTKISTTYDATSTYDATTGLYSVTVTGAAVGSANLVVTTNRTSADTTGVSAAAVSVRVGSLLPASVKVTTDKSSYAPGEKGSLLVTLLDKDGLEVVAGETYTATFDSTGIVSSYALQNSDATTFASGITSYTSGGRAYTFYAPVTEGDVKFSWTTGTTASATRTGLATANQGVEGSVVISVSSVATSAAIDAAQEASAAAQDATDAAISATEAAEEASALAQQAVDAVATLSAQVSKLITALKAQITTLSNLVAKIAKKVKA